MYVTCRLQAPRSLLHVYENTVLLIQARRLSQTNLAKWHWLTGYFYRSIQLSELTGGSLWNCQYTVTWVLLHNSCYCTLYAKTVNGLTWIRNNWYKTTDDLQFFIIRRPFRSEKHVLWGIHVCPQVSLLVRNPASVSLMLDRIMYWIREIFTESCLAIPFSTMLTLLTEINRPFSHIRIL